MPSHMPIQNKVGPEGISIHTVKSSTGRRQQQLLRPCLFRLMVDETGFPPKR